MRIRAALILVFLPIWPVLGDTLVPFRAPVVAPLEYGIFCTVPSDEKRDAPGTEAGYITISEVPPTLVRPGTQAPALLGVSFGVRWSLVDLTARYVEIRVTRPRPGGGEPIIDTWGRDFEPLAGDSSLWTFDRPEELATGDWIFEAWDGDLLLWRVTFTVVDAGAMPLFHSLCSEMISAVNPVPDLAKTGISSDMDRTAS